jgi:succinate dehydrogenase/fumarate reductase cytochrome b subunit
MSVSKNVSMEQNIPDRALGKKMRWTDYYLWKVPAPGIWAWLGTRVSALLILLFIPLHLLFTYSRLIQFVLILLIVFHGFLGIRLIIIDFFDIGPKAQKILSMAFFLTAIFVFLIVWFNLPRL